MVMMTFALGYLLVGLAVVFFWGIVRWLDPNTTGPMTWTSRVFLVLTWPLLFACFAIGAAIGTRSVVVVGSAPIMHELRGAYRDWQSRRQTLRALRRQRWPAWKRSSRAD